MIIGNSKSNLRGSVVPRLNVGIESLFLEATGAKINQFDARFVKFLQEYIFRFQITMDDVVAS